MPGMHGWGQGGESRLAVLAAACYSVKPRETSIPTASAVSPSAKVAIVIPFLQVTKGKTLFPKGPF